MARLSRARLSTALLLLLVACPFAAVSPPPPSESDGAKFVYIREGDLTEEQLRLSRAMSPGEVARARAIDETIGIRNLALDHDATLLVEGKLAVTRGRHGLSVSSLDDHWVGWCLRLIGEWEEPIMTLLGPYVRPGDTVWEAGAHIGSHTIGLAAMVSAGGANGRVHAWEPNAESRGYLHAALVLNGYGPSTVTVHDEALGGPTHDGGKRLPVNQAGEAEAGGGHEQREKNSGSFSFVGVDATAGPGADVAAGQKGEGAAPEGAAQEGAGQEGGGRRGGGAGRGSLDLNATAVVPGSVPIASLDALMAAGEISGARCPSVIKSDAEGYDFHMLAGAAETIALCKPVLYFEVMRPRASLANLEATVLRHREPGYECAWHLFRLLPKSGDMFRPPESTTKEGEAVGRANETSGPMSYNLICFPDHGQRSAAAHADDADNGVGARVEALPALPVHLPRLVDPATDLLFAGTQAECEDYEGALREHEGLMLRIVGSDRSVCERGAGARNVPS